LTTKDYRVLIFDFEQRVVECENTHMRINFFTFPEHEMQDIFAFKYTFSESNNLEKELMQDGWEVWNPEREFDICQGIDLASPNCVSSLHFILYRNSVAMIIKTGLRKRTPHV
jgi:hypothetical protein